MQITAVLGASYGDEGKGKVVHSLAKLDTFTHVIRFNGSGNAGHTIYHNGKKYATHLVPAGVFYGKPSIIGSGCVLNPNKLIEEIEVLEAAGVPVRPWLKIAYNAHIITDDHLKIDNQDVSIGTTKQGNGPAYADKYLRKGIRAEKIKELESFIVDLYDEFYIKNTTAHILAEGAQGYLLDIDSKNYPFVTSSHCGIGSLLNNGFRHQDLKEIICVIKGYDTYVGAKNFQSPSDHMLDRICEYGQEYGVTTGRRRQVNYLNISELNKSLKMLGCTQLIVNKMDILKDLDCWKVLMNNEVVDLHTEDRFKAKILEVAGCPVKFSYSPYDI